MRFSMFLFVSYFLETFSCFISQTWFHLQNLAQIGVILMWATITEIHFCGLGFLGIMSKADRCHDRGSGFQFFRFFGHYTLGVLLIHNVMPDEISNSKLLFVGKKVLFFCLNFVCQFLIYSHCFTVVDQASAYRTIVYFVSFLVPSHTLLQKADACCYRHAFYISIHLPDLFP